MSDIQFEYAYGIPYEKLPAYSMKPTIGNEPAEVSEGINYELLDEILAFIKLHPQTWRQESWYKYVDPQSGDLKYHVKVEDVADANICGTAFCFAGHVAIREGFPLPPKDNWATWGRTYTDEDGYNEYEEAWEFATKRLGLSQDVADTLFAAENTIQDLEDISKILHEVPDVDPSELEEWLHHYDPDERESVQEFINSQLVAA